MWKQTARNSNNRFNSDAPFIFIILILLNSFPLNNDPLMNGHWSQMPKYPKCTLNVCDKSSFCRSLYPYSILAGQQLLSVSVGINMMNYARVQKAIFEKWEKQNRKNIMFFRKTINISKNIIIIHYTVASFQMPIFFQPWPTSQWTLNMICDQLLCVVIKHDENGFITF